MIALIAAERAAVRIFYSEAFLFFVYINFLKLYQPFSNTAV